MPALVLDLHRATTIQLRTITPCSLQWPQTIENTQFRLSCLGLSYRVMIAFLDTDRKQMINKTCAAYIMNLIRCTAFAERLEAGTDQLGLLWLREFDCMSDTNSHGGVYYLIDQQAPCRHPWADPPAELMRIDHQVQPQLH